MGSSAVVTVELIPVRLTLDRRLHARPGRHSRRGHARRYGQPLPPLWPIRSPGGIALPERYQRGTRVHPARVM
jgi:hypothetical protein